MPTARLAVQRRRRAALTLALAILASGCGAAARRPNLLLLVVDCLRADRLGVHAAARPATPSIDALAAEGVDFTHAFAQASWTRPSIPTLLTGLYPSEHGLVDLETAADGRIVNRPLPETVETLAETLRAGGYRTLLVGQQQQLAREFGLAQGFDVYEHRAHGAADIHRRLFAALAPPAGEPAAPFFAYLHYLELHAPYCPPVSTRGRFDPSPDRLDLCHGRGWRRTRKEVRSGKREITADDAAQLAARYDEELLALDAELARLFAELRRRNLWDSTLILLTADHGEAFLEHGRTGHAQTLHEELLRVPLVVKPPAAWRGPRGVQDARLIELRSVAPTLAEAAGEALPRGGASLVPVLRGARTEAAGEPVVFAESTAEVVVRTPTLKLRVGRRGGFQLHDLAVDPLERHDVAAERQADVRRLTAHYRRWRASLEPVERSAAAAVDADTVEGLRALGYVD